MSSPVCQHAHARRSRISSCRVSQLLAEHAIAETAGADRPAASSAARMRSLPANTSPRGACTPRARAGSRAPTPAAARWPCVLPAAMSSAIHRATSLPARRLPDLERPLAASRSPSGSRDRRRARCRRSPRGARRSSGTCRGRSTTGTAPADAPTRAASRISPPGSCSSRISATARRRFAPADTVVAASRDRAPGCPCRPSDRRRRSVFWPERALRRSARRAQSGVA